MSSKVMRFHEYLFSVHANQGKKQSRLIKKPKVISNISVNNNSTTIIAIIKNNITNDLWFLY